MPLRSVTYVNYSLQCIRTVYTGNFLCSLRSCDAACLPGVSCPRFRPLRNDEVRLQANWVSGTSQVTSGTVCKFSCRGRSTR